MGIQLKKKKNNWIVTYDDTHPEFNNYWDTLSKTEIKEIKEDLFHTVKPTKKSAIKFANKMLGKWGIDIMIIPCSQYYNKKETKTVLLLQPSNKDKLSAKLRRVV